MIRFIAGFAFGLAIIWLFPKLLRLPILSSAYRFGRWLGSKL